MSLHEYQQSKDIECNQYPFYALIMAAMRQADDFNLTKLGVIYPEILIELQARYNVPGGKLKGD